MNQNQTIRYVIMTLLILALVIWSITVFRSCQETKDPIEQSKDNSTEDDTSGLDDLYSEEIDTSADEYLNTDSSIDSDEEEPFDAQEPSFGEGEFLVIAGAFIVEANANKVVNRLNQKGYDDAEVRIFLGSQYHSAIVGAYESVDNALDVAIKLADEGYKDVYVHKKRHKKNQ